MGPAKSIPMNAIMIYMSGTSLQIFTVMVTAMLFFNPVKAIMTTQQSKCPDLHDNDVTDGM